MSVVYVMYECGVCVVLMYECGVCVVLMYECGVCGVCVSVCVVFIDVFRRSAFVHASINYTHLLDQ